MASAGEVGSIGVIGETTDPCVGTIRSSQLELAAVSPTPDDVHETRPDLLVCVGTAALARTARQEPGIPLLSVDGPRGTHSVDRGRLEPALDALAAGRWTRRHRPVLRAAGPGGSHPGFLTVTLMVTPGGIAEYAIETRAGGDESMAVDQFRADGVVIATPTGSQGYPHAAGGPVVGPSVNGVSVVPVGPFTIDRDRWVLTLPIRVTVRRDEGEVTLEIDGEMVERIAQDETISITGEGSVELAVVDPATPYFRRADRLEKT